MGPAQDTQQRQRADEKEHEQKHMDVHEAFSLLAHEVKGLFPSEKVEYEASRGKVKQLGEMSDLSTTVRGCTPKPGQSAKSYMARATLPEVRRCAHTVLAEEGRRHWDKCD